MRDLPKFYDLFSNRQLKAGVTRRHNHILNGMVKFGLKPGHNVLEVGCGIETLTGLIGKFLENGSLLALDFSPESINIAKKRLKGLKNVELLEKNFLKFETDKRFDVVVFPDVLEHIPLENHFELFKKAANLMATDAFIYINIPNPYYLSWCKQKNPEVLQIIDQPVYSDKLINDIYPHGLMIYYLETYSLWVKNDYQVIVLKKSNDQNNFPEIPYKPKPIFSRVKNRLKSFW